MKTAKSTLLVFPAVVVAAIVGYGIRAARADGVPSSGALTYSGTLEDTTGKPVSGTKNISIAVWDAASGGAKVCEAPASGIGVANGRFDVLLPDACAAAAKATPNLWIEVTVEGESLGRTKLGAVPYALEAGAASEAKGALKAAVDAVIAANATKAEKSAVPTMTEWQAYVPVFACGGTPVAGVVPLGRWRREGDSVHIRGGVGFSSAPAPACSGFWTLSLPNGLTPDSAKTAGLVGNGDIVTNNSVTVCKVLLADVAVSSQCNGSVTFVRQEGAGLFNFAIGSGWEIDAVVPVAGWTATGP